MDKKYKVLEEKRTETLDYDWVALIAEQVVELYWDYDRMSSCGKEALDKLAVMVGVPTQEEFEKDIHNACT